MPVEDLQTPHPTRHTVADLETGVQYAIVLTTCAGLWSYILGDTVCFEQRDPPLLRFSGRTRYFLSAFGEHVISEEAETAVTAAAKATGSVVIDFHVGPLFPVTPACQGRHRWFIEFAETICPQKLSRFVQELDAELKRLNEDYHAHRRDDLAMLEPVVVPGAPRRISPSGCVRVAGSADRTRCRAWIIAEKSRRNSLAFSRSFSRGPAGESRHCTRLRLRVPAKHRAFPF